jgi:L-cysteine/cystine lyase
MPTLSEQRSLFPALANKIYFNYGIQGPLPRVALDAAVARWTDLQSRGPATGDSLASLLRAEEDLRSRFSTLVGAQPDEMALVDSTCTGCAIVLQGQAWRAGDHIVLTDAEYPPVVWAIERLSARFGVEHTVVPVQGRAGDAPALLAAAIRPSTRLVVVSHVLWTTGEVLDLEAIGTGCRKAGTDCRLLVDGAQGVGVIPMRLRESAVDYYAFPGHKHCMGPDGVGALFVAARAQPSLESVFCGWRGVFAGPTGLPEVRPDARRYEQATTFFAGRAAMVATLDTHDSFAPLADRAARTARAAARLHAGLREIDGVSMLLENPAKSALVSFRLRGRKPEQVVDSLGAQRIYVRSLSANDCVRPSVSYLTTDEEIDLLVQAVTSLPRA